MPHLLFEGRVVDQILIVASAHANERSTREWALALYRELRVDAQRLDHMPTWPRAQQVGRNYVQASDLLRAALEVWTHCKRPTGPQGNPGPIPDAIRANRVGYEEDGFWLLTASDDGQMMIAIEWDDLEPTADPSPG